MTMSKKWIIAAAITASLLAVPIGANAQQGGSAVTPEQNQQDIDKSVDILRSNLRESKAQFIIDRMDLTASERQGFVPVYKRFETDMTKLGDEQLAIVKDFAANFDNMTDKMAQSLTNRGLALDAKRNSLIKQYVPQFNKVLPGVKTARFVQLELLVDRAIGLQILSRLPLIR
jgi:hypothetical protein